jgi:hypothetical protein
MRVARKTLEPKGWCSTPGLGSESEFLLLKAREARNVRRPLPSPEPFSSLETYARTEGSRRNEIPASATAGEIARLDEQWIQESAIARRILAVLKRAGRSDEGFAYADRLCDALAVPPDDDAAAVLRWRILYAQVARNAFLDEITSYELWSAVVEAVWPNERVPVPERFTERVESSEVRSDLAQNARVGRAVKRFLSDK